MIVARILPVAGATQWADDFVQAADVECRLDGVLAERLDANAQRVLSEHPLDLRDRLTAAPQAERATVRCGIHLPRRGAGIVQSIRHGSAVVVDAGRHVAIARNDQRRGVFHAPRGQRQISTAPTALNRRIGNCRQNHVGLICHAGLRDVHAPRGRCVHLCCGRRFAGAAHGRRDLGLRDLTGAAVRSQAAKPNDRRNNGDYNQYFAHAVPFGSSIRPLSGMSARRGLQFNHFSSVLLCAPACRAHQGIEVSHV